MPDIARLLSAVGGLAAAAALAVDLEFARELERENFNPTVIALTCLAAIIYAASLSALKPPVRRRSLAVLTMLPLSALIADVGAVRSHASHWWLATGALMLLSVFAQRVLTAREQRS